LFVVEGKKNVAELLNSNYEIYILFATNKWKNNNRRTDVITVTNNDLKRISNQSNPNEVLALVRTKIHQEPSVAGLTLVLDDINDPGNMGTILRVCDWFGVRAIICSANTVDIYNPKVVQSAMGSIFRMPVIYTDLFEYLKLSKSPIYGAFLEGHNVKSISFPEDMFLVMGSESNGISKKISQLISNNVKINQIGDKTESLNVAVATSILLHEICI
jgi:TrmH family RNA methyltransferase